ncbi:MAG: tRNA pseudouridine(38-40) synthase TruA [Proteobacteria bacterium]|nr:tRNA pseudouridine(38-40) synthase TruA [Pseudomonadota bacterium]
MNQSIDKDDRATHPKRRIKLILSYSGAGFFGWQSQSAGTGIQDLLEKCLFTILREKIRVTAASRTDTGVHADYQVVCFSTVSSLAEFKILRALNALLPSTVRVRDASLLSEFTSSTNEKKVVEFHPIFSAKSKLYVYRIWRAVGEHQQIMPYVWHMTRPLDVSSLLTATEQFVGVHDFTSFCAADSSAKTKTRNVIGIHIRESGPLLEIWFHGEGFLKQMVRNIVGTLVAVGTGKLDVKSIPEIFLKFDRRAAPATAPAQGLTLAYIFYEKPGSIEDLVKNSNCMYTVPLWGSWYDF